MATWLVEYWPYVNCDLDDPGTGRELPCFRIVPEDDHERWIAQTNPHLPREAQEETALLMAEVLSQVLGI
jgi:hypothetical protein